MPRSYAFANVDNRVLYTGEMEEGAQYRGFSRRGKPMDVQKGWGWEMRLGCC